MPERLDLQISMQEGELTETDGIIDPLAVVIFATTVVLCLVWAIKEGLVPVTFLYKMYIRLWITKKKKYD